jgi:hypothetical protein
MHQSMNASINQSINESINQAINRSMNQSISESTNQPENVMTVDEDCRFNQPAVVFGRLPIQHKVESRQ